MGCINQIMCMVTDDQAMIANWDVTEFHTAKDLDALHRHVECYNVPLTRWHIGENCTFTDENEGQANDIESNPVQTGDSL